MLICKIHSASQRRVFIKTGSQRSTRLLSMFSVVFRRVRFSVIYVGQQRRYCAIDSIFRPCLNLRSRKWLRPSRRLVINLIPLGLWQLKKLLADDLINRSILFLKTFKLLEFLMLWSSLFHSTIVDGKKELLNKVLFQKTEYYVYL